MSNQKNGQPTGDRFGCIAGGGGGLSLISNYSSSSSESEAEDAEFGGLAVNGKFKVISHQPKLEPPEIKPKLEVGNFDAASVNLGGPTDFGDVKVKEEKVGDTNHMQVAVIETPQNVDSEMCCIEEAELRIEPPAVAIESSSSLQVVPYNGSNSAAYRNEDVEGTSDSESDSVITVENDSSDSDSITDHSDSEGGRRKKSTKNTKRPDFSFNDLPPIEDLHISVPHEKCKLIGKIKSVVDPLVMVESVPNVPVLNLESVLFLDEGDRALGQIFDVIGNVKAPYYCVRFNSKEHIEKNGVHPGMNVYCAPETDYTSYVFVAQLRQMKGSDASWKDDIEAPPEEQEFSDDEMERMIKNGGRKTRQKQRKATATDAIVTENPDQNGHHLAYDNNTRRGQKRPQGYNRPYTQSQNGANYNQQFHQSPFVPPYVAGFTPPHSTRPPFHRYNHPRQFYQTRPWPGNSNRIHGPHSGPRAANGFGQSYPHNGCNPQRYPHIPPYQDYNMWSGNVQQQNYWQNNVPAVPVQPSNTNPYPNPGESSQQIHADTSNNQLQPPPPGV